MNATIDDVDSHIVYSSNPAWNTDVWAQQSPQPLYGTNHGTPNPGATATFTFNGTAGQLNRFELLVASYSMHCERDSVCIWLQSF